jgi:hypothetical protein
MIRLITKFDHKVGKKVPWARIRTLKKGWASWARVYQQHEKEDD